MRRGHLTYANVVSTIGVFLLLAGGTALAAKGLAKNSVGPKQLKANAVTTAKIKKGAVTKAKLGNNAVTSAALADGAVTGTKIADGAVSGSKIAAGSTGFSQRVARLTRNEAVPISSGATYPIGAFTQSAGEAMQILGSIEIEFSAACVQPRSTQVYLLMDSPFPFPTNLAGFASFSDKGAGAVRMRAPISPFPGLGSSLSRAALSQSKPHTFALYLNSATCSSGTGANLLGTQVDILGVK